MFRAAPFGPFLFFLNSVLPDALDQQKLASQIQLSFDRIDPLTYAPRLLSNTLDGSPASRRVLLQIGIGDSAVNPLAAHLHARAFGASHLLPHPRPIAALPAATPPFDGSALQEFDFKKEAGVLAIPPNEDTGVHEAVRRLPASREQLARFLQPDGKIEQTCDGVCDPE